MSKKNDSGLIIELRSRINNLKTISNSGPFFREVARLTEWIGDVSSFGEPLLDLELQRKIRDKKLLKILKDIRKEGEKIWLIIKTVPIKLEKLPEQIQHSLAMLNQYYELSHPQFGIGIYHNLRYVIEYLVSEMNLTKFNKFIDTNNEAKYPLLKGKIFNLFVEYSREQELIKKELATSLWGAWDNLKHTSTLASMDKDYPKLEDWAKTYEKDDYFVYFFKVTDYLFDYLILGNKSKMLNPDPLLEEAIWDNKFAFDDADNLAKFCQYGQVKFWPEKSPNKSESNSDPTPTVLIVKKLLEGGKSGINKTKLAEYAKIEERNLKAYINSIDKVFSNAYSRKMINAKIYISERNKTLELIVVPIEYEDQSSPVDA